MTCPFLRNKFSTKSFILLNFLVVLVILVFHLSISSDYSLEFWSRSVFETFETNLALKRLYFVNPVESAWAVLGGFRRTPFDDIGKLRKFTGGKSRTKKVILRVGDFNFDDLSWKDGSEHLERIDCPITNCHFTSDRSYSRVADALVISEFSWKELLWYFRTKPLHQVWIAQHLESPYHNRLYPRFLKGLINWTATYRLDSTISLPYGSWLALKNETSTVSNGSVRNYAEGRTRKVAMFVSNCKDKNGRLSYARELGRHIEVHIYGACTNRRCPEDESLSSATCFDMLSRDYKFYLSFENSNCVGYITEKLHYNALSHDVVPIVMGARPEDYAVSAPPGSFIHVDDFRSPQDLAAYLNVLDRNDTLYNEYFRYKSHFKYFGLGQQPNIYWCQLCAMLHLSDHVIADHSDDYERWWSSGCYARNDGKHKWKTWKRNET